MDVQDQVEDAATDVLELERIAIGPYCTYDTCHVSEDQTDNEPSRPTTPRSANMEEGPTMSEFPFTAAVPAPWVRTSMDDPALMEQQPEQFAQSNWEDWMTWPPDPLTIDLNTGVVTGQSARQYESVKDGMLVGGLQYHTQHQNDVASNDHNTLPPHSSTTTASPTFMFAPTSSPMQFTAGNTFDPNTHRHLNQHSPLNFVQQHDSKPDLSRVQTLSPLARQSIVSDQSLPAMSTPSLQHSPGTSSNGRTASDSTPSSPEPVSATDGSNNKKRKASDDEEEDDDAEPGKQGPVKKTSHNMIEKRYRTNLNDKIAALRDSVPSLRQASRPAGSKDTDDAEDLEGLTPAHKLNKATVLSKATEYIRHLEKRNKQLSDELKKVQTQLDNRSKLAISAPVTHGLVSTPEAFRFQEDSFGHSTSHSPPQGMIAVPENMANLYRRAQNQAHYAQTISSANAQYNTGPARQGIAAQQPMINGRRGNGMVGRMMIGSLAGLMVLEAYTESRDEDEDAVKKAMGLPFGLLGHLSSISLSSGSALPLFKLLLLITAFFYILNPLLNFRPSRGSRKLSAPAIRLAAPPSLAVPVELRRKAWLTAIQTVWVPRHNLLLEAAALGLKTFKLGLKNTIGWEYFALVSGATKEGEEARVKAWEIALDAQLTGGDAEISVSRLLLTLIASGTLPDTPIRLMLKALHIRVLLWEIANSDGWLWYALSLILTEEVNAKIARHYWNAARVAHQISLNDKKNDVTNPIPRHLAALLEIECDDVLVRPLIQRAYNLAWYKPSAEKTDIDVGLDSVVEDFAIASPLDALAAWWSGLMLNRALSNFLAEDEVWTEDLGLALTTAPPTSGAHVRALVAKSIIIEESREKAVAAAFAAMPSQTQACSPTKSAQKVLINVVGNAPVSSDVLKSLTMARCLSLAEISAARNSSEARIRATFPINTNYISEYSLTLLSFVAAYRILITFSANEQLLAESRQGLERLAGVLRVWVGRAQGRKSGLNSKTRGVIVDSCLKISKTLTGMVDKVLPDESDDGYASGEEVAPSVSSS